MDSEKQECKKFAIIFPLVIVLLVFCLFADYQFKGFNYLKIKHLFLTSRNWPCSKVDFYGILKYKIFKAQRSVKKRDFHNSLIPVSRWNCHGTLKLFKDYFSSNKPIGKRFLLILHHSSVCAQNRSSFNMNSFLVNDWIWWTDKISVSQNITFL